jgi:hypothetical protein
MERASEAGYKQFVIEKELQKDGRADVILAWGNHTWGSGFEDWMNYRLCEVPLT